MMIKITHKGVEKNLADWAKYYGMPAVTMYARYKKHGDDPTKLFKKYKPYEGKEPQLVYGKEIQGVQNDKGLYLYNGKEQNLHRWATELGVNHKVLYMRARRGLRGEALFAKAREWIPKKKYES
jgi:hypothetical protein